MNWQQQIEQEHREWLEKFYQLLESLPPEMLRKLNITLDKQQPEEPKLERWKPSANNPYWINSFDGDAGQETWDGSQIDRNAWNFFNVFQTKKEAQQEAHRTRARRKLEWLARELNAKSKPPYQIVGFTLTPDFGITVHQYNPPHLSAFYFNRREDAEYALSQMTSEELEALR